MKTNLEKYMHTEDTHTYTYLSVFCIDFLMPTYAQFGLLCVTKTAVLSVKSRHKQLAKRHKKKKETRSGKRH